MSGLLSFFPLPPTRYPIKRFDSNADLDAYVREFEYSQDLDVDIIAFAVSFQSGYPAWDYTVRVNYTALPSDGPPQKLVPPTDTLFKHTTKQQGNSFYTNNEDCQGVACAYLYTTGPDPNSQGMTANSFALSIQQMISDFAVYQTRVLSGESNVPAGDKPLIELSVSAFPFPEFKEDGFWGM